MLLTMLRIKMMMRMGSRNAWTRKQLPCKLCIPSTSRTHSTSRPSSLLGTSPRECYPLPPTQPSPSSPHSVSLSLHLRPDPQPTQLYWLVDKQALKAPSLQALNPWHIKNTFDTQTFLSLRYVEPSIMLQQVPENGVQLHGCPPDVTGVGKRGAV